MPTAIEKALDFIGGMNTSASVPHSMDESTAKGILKYLHDFRCASESGSCDGTG